MKTEYINFLKEHVKLEVIGRIKTAGDHHKLKCLLCQSKFTATPKSKVQNYKKSGYAGCPECTRKQRYNDTHVQNIEKLKSIFCFNTPSDFSNNTMLEVKNKECGHVFVSKVGNLLNRNVTCPVCAKNQRADIFREHNYFRHTMSQSSSEGLSRYRKKVRVITEQNYQKYRHIINPNGLERKRSGQDGWHLDHIMSIKYCYEQNVPEEICAHVENLRMIPWKENAVKWAHRTSNIPKIFKDYLPQSEIVLSFQNAFDFDKNVEIIPPYVFDLYDPDNHVAVIFHNIEDITEMKVNTKKYLMKLRERCLVSNIRLVQVFSDEWLSKPDVVKSKINHIMGITESKPLYARKTKIKEIPNSVKNKFLDSYHIQGSDKSQVNLGAFNGDELVAVMTFCKPRVLMNKRQLGVEGVWELSRFATHSSYRIVGVGSKLLKFFVSSYPWDEIYSFADLRWTDANNNVYDKSGFMLDKKKTAPEYYYVINGKRMHRWGFRKDALKEKFPTKYDSSKTEYENMLALGYDRVWDAGNLKYIMKNTN